MEIELSLAGSVVVPGLRVRNLLLLLGNLADLLLWHLTLNLLHLLRLSGKLLRLLHELLLLVGNLLLELLLLGKLLLLVLRRRGRGRVLAAAATLVVLRVDAGRVAVLASDVLAEDEGGDEEKGLSFHGEALILCFAVLMEWA